MSEPGIRRRLRFVEGREYWGPFEGVLRHEH